QHRLNDQMLHPNFPVPLQIMGADLKFVDINVGKSIKISDDIVVETALLNHPGEAVGYRVNWRNYAAAYVSDTEHFPDRLDENVLFLARDADVLIYDATYSDEQYHSEKTSKVGWGHSTWQEAVKVAKAANVKRLVIFHHDPLHNDDLMDKVGEQVAERFPDSLIAREGLSIQLSSPAISSPSVL
ncbi:MAG: MBL fold metallo-hydrolase, partial [Planktothrix sp.]